MDKLKELLRSLFANDPEKQKIVDSLDIKPLHDEREPSLENKTSDENSRIAKLEAMVAKLLGDNKNLVDLVTAMTEKEKKREETIKTQSEKERAEQISKILEDAVKDTKIPAKNDEIKNTYKSILEKDFENGKKIIEALPKLGSNPSQNGQGSTYKTESGKQSGLNSSLKPEFAKYVESVPTSIE